MAITDGYFLIMVLMASVLYYIMPKTWQWKYLLVISMAFYCVLAESVTLIYILLAAAIAWLAGIKAQKSRGILIGAIIFLFMLLIIMKYIPKFPFIAAMGVSYYTLSLVGYLLDVRWGIISPERNYFKVLLFTCYFPQMVSGPICKYGNMEKELYTSHSFSMDRYAEGCCSVLWGCFMKLVIAGRSIPCVTAILDAPSLFNGFIVLGGVILFVIQLFCDFAGCMYIITGISKIFGITFPENFNAPFFSRSVQEWWQRWHMTLGQWTKEYILFPSLKSNALISLRDALASRTNKKIAKKIVTYLGMLFVWIYIGIWHGGKIKFLLLGFYFWLLIILENEKKMKEHNCVFGIIRTVLLCSLGNVFFYGNDIRACVSIFYYIVRNIFYPVKQSLSTLASAEGVDSGNIIFLAFCIMILLTAEFIRWRCKESVILWLRKRNWILRWGVIYMIFFLTIIYGIYGRGYAVTEFIYQGF